MFDHYKERKKRQRQKSWIKESSVEEVNTEPTKWDFPFCLFFTNQAGTVILSFVGFALMVTTLLFNWFALNKAAISTRIIQNLLLHIYLILMLFGFVLAFVSAYHEVDLLAIGAAVMVGAGTMLYILFSILSCFKESMAMVYVCPEMRCADHHWLQEAYWRGYVVYSENSTALEAAMNYIMSEEESHDWFDKYMKGNVLHLHLEAESTELRKYLKIKKPYRNKAREAMIKAPEYLEGRKTNDTKHYIHVISDQEGAVLHMLLSAFSTLWLLGFFMYSAVTFYAFGRKLSIVDE